MEKKPSDREIMSSLGIDAATLKRFREIRAVTIKEAGLMKAGTGKIKVLGISGSARDKFDMAQEDSSSEALLTECLARCEKLGAKTELLKLREHSIEHCKACYSTANAHCHFYCSCYPKGTPQADDMSNVLYDKVLEADAIIFATPVNNFSMSTPMKEFLDRCISLDGSLPPANEKSPKDRELNIKHADFIRMSADGSLPGSGFLKRFSGKVAGVIVTGHEEGAALVISSLFMTLNSFGMLFPPFSNVYAISSRCRLTNEDKEIVLSECYRNEVRMLAENVVAAARLSRTVKPHAWKYDYGSD
jgi:multimeric flavodoxin WrbA